MPQNNNIVPFVPTTEMLGRIQHSILVLRGKQVLLDFQLAALYGVETRTLKQAVRRNSCRFPEDFMFQLTSEECNFLISNGGSQSVIPPGYNFGATPEERADYTLSPYGIHWEKLDEDLCYEGFFRRA